MSDASTTIADDVHRMESKMKEEIGTTAMQLRDQFQQQLFMERQDRHSLVAEFRRDLEAQRAIIGKVEEQLAVQQAECQKLQQCYAKKDVTYMVVERARSLFPRKFSLTIFGTVLFLLLCMNFLPRSWDMTSACLHIPTASVQHRSNNESIGSINTISISGGVSGITSTTSIAHIKRVICHPGQPTVAGMSVQRSDVCSEAYRVVFDLETSCGGELFDGRLDCANGRSEGGPNYQYFAFSVPIGRPESVRHSISFDCVEPTECVFAMFIVYDFSFQRFFQPAEARTEAEILHDIQAARNHGLQLKKTCTGSIMNAHVSTAELSRYVELGKRPYGLTLDMHSSLNLRVTVVTGGKSQDPKHLDPICAVWPSPLPISGTWAVSTCMPDCRPGYVPGWVLDQYVWKPHGCRLQYVSLNTFLTVLKELGITGIILFGDSRQMHLHNELHEFLAGKSQMPGPEPPPSTVNNDFGSLINQILTAGYGRNRFPSTIHNVSLFIAETWGEVEDDELMHCFEGDDLANKTVYLQMRHSLGTTRAGLRVIERTMSLVGHEVDLVVWTAGLHNIRCSLSNEVLLVYLKQEALVFKKWALDGIRLGRNRTIIYREELGVHNPNLACVSNERIKSINRMASSVVQSLDRDLREHAVSAPGGRLVRARAVYLGSILDMSMGRLDRIYDMNAHFYPEPKYPHSWKAFPRLVNSEMLLLLITALQRLQAGVDVSPGLA